MSRGRIGFAYAGLTSSLSRQALSRARLTRSAGPTRFAQSVPSCAGPELHAERAIHMADTSQSARAMWVTLAQPKGTKDGNYVVHTPLLARQPAPLTFRSRSEYLNLPSSAISSHEIGLAHVPHVIPWNEGMNEHGCDNQQHA